MLLSRILPPLSLMFLLHAITGDAETPLMIHVLPEINKAALNLLLMSLGMI